MNNYQENTIKIMVETLTEKDQQINYWKRKAYILANKLGQCPEHDDNKNDRPYNLDEYLKVVECIDCDLITKNDGV